MRHARQPYRTGLTPKEEAVMSRWDNGMSYGKISRETGQHVDAVKKIVANYHIGPSDSARSIIRGSQNLLNAIRKYHGPRVVREGGAA